MIVADKTLNDSVLSVTLFFVSNKTAPKGQNNAPIFTGAKQNKITKFSHHCDGCKGKHNYWNNKKAARWRLSVWSVAGTALN